MKHALYFSRYCYFCQKVLMRLRDREHQIELRDVADETHRMQLVDGGGKSQVPCLFVHKPDQDRVWLYESDDIIKYIDQHGLLV